MGAVGVDHDGEAFFVGDKLIDKGLGTLIMYVVIPGAMHQQKVSP
jgi:hypothetical protein